MSVNAWLIIIGLLFVGGILVFSVVRFLTRKRVPYWEAETASTDWWAVLGVSQSDDLDVVHAAYGDKLKAVPRQAHKQENETQRRAREAHLEALRVAYQQARQAKVGA
ncbi:MAG: hypothetical protein ACR2QB_11525 [Gammaproteobacteria bacterium]